MNDKEDKECGEEDVMNDKECSEDVQECSDEDVMNDKECLEDVQECSDEDKECTEDVHLSEADLEIVQ